MTEFASAAEDDIQADPAAEANDETSSPAWAAIVSLSLGVFGLVTAEFLPASLLTPLAADLNITEGAAGQAVTATAIVGAIAAPTMAIVTKRLDRRIVMWALTTLLVLSNILAASASGLTTLLLARVLLGVSLGGFWSMAAAMAMRLVPMRLMPRAMSIILTGVSIATVCAAPVGAYVGSVWGWRAAFVIAASIAAVTLLAQMITLPKLPPIGSPGLRTLFEILKLRRIRIGLLAVLLIASGHFAGFTYIRPFLEQVPAFDVQTISLVLLAYGIGGFLGNFAGAFVIERSLRAAVALAPLLIAATSLALIAYGSSALVAAAAVALWGFGFGAVPVGLQTWMAQAADDQAESAGGLFIATFQIAIAGGAILGGLLVDNSGVASAFAYCGIATLLAAIAVFVLGKERQAG
jgi:predicted MFS family arabinose efflux permease